jgi:SAM-dependent methyltransferase
MDPTAYELHYRVEARHWWFVARRAIVADAIRALGLPRPARILDFGAGTGGNLEMLSEFGQVVAVEPDPGARDFARSKARGAAIVGSLEEVRGPFDVILLSDVLEHLEEPPETLRVLRGLLGPGGRLVVTVPAHAWLYGSHDRYLHHHRRYSGKLLDTHLRAGGFRVISRSATNAMTLGGAIVVRVLEMLRGDRGSAPRGMTVPPRAVNALLAAALKGERRVFGDRLPIGLSWLAVAEVEGDHGGRVSFTGR